MEIIQTILLSIIQGIAEFLPISSSGHLIIFSWFMSGQPLPLSLNVSLHFGTLLAVLIYFRKDWINLTFAAFELLKTKSFVTTDQKLLYQLVLASIPAGLVGIFFKDLIEIWLHHPIIVIFPLGLVGLLLWFIDKKSKSEKSISELSNKEAFLIGLAQMMALIPGVSRSGATIAMARFLHLSRYQAARFSFLLGTPAMLGASLIHIKDFLAHQGDPSFYIGILTAFLSGLLTIHFLLSFLQRFGFAIFAIYRLILAIGIGFIVLR